MCIKNIPQVISDGPILFRLLQILLYFSMQNIILILKTFFMEPISTKTMSYRFLRLFFAEAAY